nr:hypothetical protein GCM10017745_10100 [Saccharothrix mutabilis subsp. capreolus]
MARAVIISQTYSDVGLPNSRQSCRNATLVMPAIGASTTAGSTAYGPIRRSVEVWSAVDIQAIVTQRREWRTPYAPNPARRPGHAR